MCHEKLHWDLQARHVSCHFFIRIMCHEKLHWDKHLLILGWQCSVRVMCHEKLHWDGSETWAVYFFWYQSYVPWKVALRHIIPIMGLFIFLSELCAMKSCTETWMQLSTITPGISELCAMKSCTETMSASSVLPELLSELCAMKMHWDFIRLFSVMFRSLSELCAMKSCTETFCLPAIQLIK